MIGIILDIKRHALSIGDVKSVCYVSIFLINSFPFPSPVVRLSPKPFQLQRPSIIRTHTHTHTDINLKTSKRKDLVKSPIRNFGPITITSLTYGRGS